MHEPHAPRVTPGVHCQHLRHKAMYVMSVPNPDVVRFYDKYDGAAYWCLETAGAFGPDLARFVQDISHAAPRAAKFVEELAVPRVGTQPFCQRAFLLRGQSALAPHDPTERCVLERRRLAFSGIVVIRTLDH